MNGLLHNMSAPPKSKVDFEQTQLEKYIAFNPKDLAELLGNENMTADELKTAVGTSVFIMTFTAFTGAVSHFAIGGMPDWTVWILCVLFTLLWARIAAVFANKATPKTLNRVTGVILVILGIVVMSFSMLTK